MTTFLTIIALVSLTVTAVLLSRSRRIAKAVELGFMYDDYLSFNENCQLAMSLREYAHAQADLLEATGRRGINYRENLYDRGLKPSVIDSHCTYEIAQICTDICSALKC